MKYRIAKMLKDAMPGYVSGGEIGRRFHVTRAAIWKHMEELRQEGYVIEAASRKGYRLVASDGNLHAWEISDGLNTEVVGKEIRYFDVLDSTNRYAGRLALEGCADGLTVIAGQQTGGRGRLGRTWESPAGSGIYLSVVLRPQVAPSEAPVLTLAAAVAAVAAIRKATGLQAGIKWPNDLILERKKVCGILLEMNSEPDRVNYVILGIGINFSQKTCDFPEELRDRAISLEMAGGRKDSGRLELIRELLRELDSMLKLVNNGDTGKVLSKWRKDSITLGREVRFRLKDREYSGMAADIMQDGRLVVDCTDGVRRELLSGEISVRGINGYV